MSTTSTVHATIFTSLVTYAAEQRDGQRTLETNSVPTVEQHNPAHVEVKIAGTNTYEYCPREIAVAECQDTASQPADDCGLDSLPAQMWPCRPPSLQ